MMMKKINLSSVRFEGVTDEILNIGAANQK